LDVTTAKFVREFVFDYVLRAMLLEVSDAKLFFKEEILFLILLREHLPDHFGEIESSIIEHPQVSFT
jgi:hypothetical protein